MSRPFVQLYIFCPECMGESEQYIPVEDLANEQIIFDSLVCPECGNSHNTGIHRLTIYKDDDSFDIPLYHGPLV